MIREDSFRFWMQRRIGDRSHHRSLSNSVHVIAKRPHRGRNTARNAATSHGQDDFARSTRVHDSFAMMADRDSRSLARQIRDHCEAVIRASVVVVDVDA